MIWLLWLVPFALADGTGDDIASAAQDLLGGGRLERNDCSGFVQTAYSRAGVPHAGNTASYWADAARSGGTHFDKRPKPGDLAFFDNTYDKNRNGRVDDELSHVAIVVSIDEDGTIHMVHNSNSKPVRTLTMNLERPDLFMKGGKKYNDYLRANNYGPESGPRLAGQLWRGFARLSPEPAKTGSSPKVAGNPQRSASTRAADVSTPTRGSSTRSTSGRASRHAAVDRPPGVALEPPTLVESDAYARARAGRKVRKQQLEGLECTALWQVRNVSFARHGYDFSSDVAEAFFEGESWYERDPSLTMRTIGRELTKRDLNNIAKAKEAESAQGCGRIEERLRPAVAEEEPPPPELSETRAYNRARKGRETRYKDLRPLSCADLWQVRNVTYARHGYDFRSERAEAFFEAQRWYKRDAEVTMEVIGDLLTDADLNTIQRVKEAEALGRCR